MHRQQVPWVQLVRVWPLQVEGSGLLGAVYPWLPARSTWGSLGQSELVLPGCRLWSHAMCAPYGTYWWVRCFLGLRDFDLHSRV